MLCIKAKIRQNQAKSGWAGKICPGYYGLAQLRTFGLGVSHDSLSAALEHAKHERRELCSISALHRGSRSECLQAAFRDVKPTQAQPSALSPQPSPSLLASERAHQAPAVSPPQPPHRCWSLAGTSVKQGWPLRAACLCCWCQCASESVCASQHV